MVYITGDIHGDVQYIRDAIAKFNITQQPNYPKLGRKVGLRIFYPLYRGR